MGGSFKNRCVPFLNFSILYFVIILPYCAQSTLISSDNYHKLIYKQCSNKTNPNNLSHSSLLAKLFQDFISQSSKSKFFETIVYDNYETSISGTYQCRKDLTTDECHNCVSKFPQLSNELCSNNNEIPSRIQLLGCYARYEEDGPENENEPGIQILHKSCSEYKVKRNSGFEEMKNAALFALESAVLSGNGFCQMNYESFGLMAECAANLRGCDCGECVNNAVQICEEECGNSVYAELYLEGCFVSYEYYGDRGIGSNSFEGNGIGGRTAKLVAIGIGAAILSGVILCFLIRSFRKKRDDW
ncbi:plasmodesmata-located protein 2-like [Primulina tabacum]|uniref:plasmodesmata-located protein 2-like n=1 Tax=Primulina tabacum TaxID=48773 RepID=UPI003F597E4A